ncbi:uncharacterized protein LOC133284446 [Gastrolobium bilobum]|uniref:uncharacterized protein LOC133284446 n=1 Tax=Gastrolobium bilobum TaxID=150636 RepID=UPI002AAFD3C3|nr:uncharacterized protein LOC133284446 [Gastrolobium bilobum]
MSSRYPILDNRPIHQWKVTELKEELKRRKLTTKGLKDDLVKRLDEALRVEREAAEASQKDEANGFDGHVAEVKDSQEVAVDAEEVNIIESESVKTIETAEKGNSDVVEPIETENTEKIPEVVDNDSNKNDKQDDATKTFETAEKGNSDVVEPIEMENTEKIPEVVDNDSNKNDKQDDATKTFETAEKGNSDVVQPIETESSEKILEVVDNDSNKNDKQDDATKTFETAEKGNRDVVEPTEMENPEKIPEVVDSDSNKNDKQDDVTIPVDINNSVSAMDEEFEHTGLPAGVDSSNVGEELTTHASAVETTITVTESVLTEAVDSGQYSYSAEKNNDDSTTKLENEELKVQLDNEDSKPQMECDTKPLSEDLVPNSSVPENQVSEVNPSLGSQVKSDSISTDSVSINQKNELKDTIITDNVKLEQDIVRPEMVEEPSSRNDVPVYDESHSMDGGGLHEKKASVEENNNNITSPDLNKTNSSDDVGYPEKLNLDRSSGDDSMEEDLPETKQFDSKFNVDELRDKVESIEVPIVKEENITIVVGDGLSAGKGDTHQDIDISPVALAEKRKFHEQASVGNSEPTKRQRRWNTETVKGPDPQSTTPRPATTPKDEPVALKRNFARSDSSATDDAPKERSVPPSQRSPTNSLRIDRFLRPFTLKAVQELLGKNGNVSSFWMDQIKTHCYVTYSSIEEAIETRNAVYNLQWPPNGGRLLVAEYVDPEEVKMKLEAPPTQVASVNIVPTVPPAPPSSKPEPSPRQHREQHTVPVTLPPPPPLSKPPPVARERLPSPPPLPEKVDPPIVTLDDLFRKTTATPRIYYLPLSEEQVAAKLAAQGKSTRQ